VRVVRTRRGARIVHGRSILSEILKEPGPTDSVFDVLAAVAAMRGDEARVAMLGFAAGGMIAPLRALGSDASVRAVDLDVSMVPLFEELCAEFADVIIEDLSVSVEDDVTKPLVSFEVLPALIRSRLSRSGLAVVNVLPLSGWSWPAVTEALVHPWRGRGAQIVFTEYVNRFVVVGRDVPEPAELSRTIKTLLRGIGSEIAEKFSVLKL
jgi:hypothetical protein